MPNFAALQTSDLLKRCGLVFRSEFKILICLVCEVAYPPSHIITHQRSNHELKITKEDLDSIVSKYSPHADTQSVLLPLPLQAPVEGIKIEKKALQCTCEGCVYVCLKDSTLRTHWSTCHRDLQQHTAFKDRFSFVEAQTLFGISCRHPFFSVKSREDISVDLFTLFMKQYGDRSSLIPPTSLPTRNHDIPILVKTLDWYHHLQKYCEDKDL